MQTSVAHTFLRTETRLITWRVDLFLIAVIAILISALCFSNVYFGDELNPLILAHYFHGNIWQTLLALCRYKPRIIFWAIWATIAVHHAPRIVPMIINTMAFVSIAWMIYYWAIVRCHASRWLVWISVLAILFSRFGVVLYFDYIAGILESLSLALFMAGILVGSRQETPLFKVGPVRQLLSVILIICSVFVYEPFIASAVVFAVILILDTLAWKGGKNQRLSMFIYSIALLILPLLLFYLATKWLSVLPISTGTHGRDVSLSSDTFKAFCIYVSNLFLGTNIGEPWLVGSLTLGARNALPLFIISALVMIGSYIYVVKDALMKYRTRFMTSLKWLLLVGAVIAVSSLPFRHEGRWMFPAFVFLILSILALFQGRRVALLLGVLLVLDAVYLAAGSEYAIYNVYSARTVSRIVASLSTVQPAGREGALIGFSRWPIAGAPHSTKLSETFRGYEEFARANLSNRYLLVPVAPGDKVNSASFDFGLVRDTLSPVTSPRFSLVNRKVVDMLLNPPERIDDASCHIVGGFGKWTHWTLTSPDMLQSSGGLLIQPSAYGFRELPVASLQGRVLAYMAHSENKLQQPMRLQINWQDKDGVFLGASISVVEVGSENKEYTTYVAPPDGAETGSIYATTHGGATGGIVIDAICLY